MLPCTVWMALWVTTPLLTVVRTGILKSRWGTRRRSPLYTPCVWVQVPLEKRTKDRVLMTLLPSTTLSPIKLDPMQFPSLQLKSVHFPAWDPRVLKKLQTTLPSGSLQRTLIWAGLRQATLPNTFCCLRYSLTTPFIQLPGVQTRVLVTGLLVTSTAAGLGQPAGPLITIMLLLDRAM